MCYMKKIGERSRFHTKESKDITLAEVTSIQNEITHHKLLERKFNTWNKKYLQWSFERGCDDFMI